jgi:hypothetical protein
VPFLGFGERSNAGISFSLFHHGDHVDAAPAPTAEAPSPAPAQHVPFGQIAAHLLHHQPRLAAPRPPVTQRLKKDLLNLGAAITLMIASGEKDVETIASDLAIDLEHLYAVMAGKVSDVSVGTLDALASHLGAKLSISLAPNPPTEP